MKADLHIEIELFTVPNFARRKQAGTGRGDEMSIPLSDLSPETLESLCDEFRREVFKKAGKSRPPQPG